MTFPQSGVLNSPVLKWQGVSRKKHDWIGLWQKMACAGPAVLLESSGRLGDSSRWLILAGGLQKEYFFSNGQSYASDGSEPHPVPFDVFDFLDHVGRSEDPFIPLPHCLSRSWFGLFSYEFGKRMHLRKDIRGPVRPSLLPECYFFKPRFIMAYDRQSNESHFFGNESVGMVERILNKEGAFKIDSFEPEMALKEYEKMVRKAKAYIRDGDIYQANLSQDFKARWSGSAGNLYRLLREMNPGPFMGLFKGKNFTVVSSSPERLVAGQGDWLETRPIAGTRPRGRDPMSDLQLKLDLKKNDKEQAEHLMLVDLARNDIGRISDFGTVDVKNYAEVESYSTVHHLVSTIQARRQSSSNMSDVFKAMFPGGTITGCPKIRCMEIIEELEKRDRGFYTGSMGYLGPGPSFDFNILIRSFTLLTSGELVFSAGAGIVADSDPKKEYMETLYKVEALAKALGTSFMSMS